MIEELVAYRKELDRYLRTRKKFSGKDFKLLAQSNDITTYLGDAPAQLQHLFQQKA